VPGLALLLTLLIWHIVSRQSWQLRGWVPLLMLAESIVMTAPLFVLNRLALQAIAGDAAESAALAGTGLRIQIVLALGAAIYEELVFRLFLVSVIALLAVDLLKAPQRTADIVAIIVAAVVFALCHVHPVGADPFVWRSFLMRCAAGAYLSVLFIGRGLGICTGCHAAYNLILVALAAG
jgi:membrane protease YdiL (CAAX protease family)